MAELEPLGDKATDELKRDFLNLPQNQRLGAKEAQLNLRTK
jgi:hypothetical protein